MNLHENTNLEAHRPELPAPELLCSLIDQHKIAAFLIDINSEDVLWSSDATVLLDSRLVAGASLPERVPELHAVLRKPLLAAGNDPDLLSSDNQSRVLANCTLKTYKMGETGTGTSDGSVLNPDVETGSSVHSCVASNSRVKDVKVSIRSVSRFGNLLVLQIEREQQLDNYYHQYVSDREKLFNTSRALTVNEMATTLAHELNQPIGTVANLVHGCLERLQQHNMSRSETEDGFVDNDVLDALDFAIRQSRFASQIIARIREFTEARQPKMEKVDVRDLVQESVQLLDWVLASEHMHLSLHAGEKQLLVACDRMLLQQVLVNLCRNAIEAMRDIKQGERHLDVHLYLSDDGVHIDIVDSGPGMADESISDMFKPFVSSKRDGMGVGLNICRSFVELHQGRLWITGNEGQGCTVHIRIPALDPGDLIAAVSEDQ